MRSDHLRQIDEAINNVYALNNLSPWITKHTYHEGKKISFKDREYQPTIVDREENNVFVKKCAQTGLTELYARYILGAACTQENFTTIWTFPTTNDATKFTQARLDPIISSSPEIRGLVSNDVNNSELKLFGDNSFVYIRGTISETGALSVPADMLVHDEYDRSDMDNISAYVSRLQARPHKLRRIFSTPTAKGYGIDKLCETSRRMVEIWQCSCCNHHFIPDYYNNVVIPGFTDDKTTITKITLKNLDYLNAKLLCPKCGREPSNDMKYREWIAENPSENYRDISYHVTPFCAPRILKPDYLVVASTEFEKESEFRNQVLGLTSESDDDVLTLQDLQSCETEADLNSTEPHYLGLDMGVTCHATIGRLTSTGELLIVHREKINYMQVEVRVAQLVQLYRLRVMVADMFPYTDIVTRLTERYPQAFGAIYALKSTSPETHWIKEQVENPEEGKLNVRQVSINRNVALDELMGAFKKKQVVNHRMDDQETYNSHLLDMKRIQKPLRFGGMFMSWEKTKGEDHYHHSTMYLWTACKLRGVGVTYKMPTAVPLLSKFRLNS